MEEKLKRILTDNLFMNLATSTLQGDPWSTPVFYAFDQDLNIYWYSRKDTKHSQNIRENNKVAISIYSTTGIDKDQGVYMEGKANEISEDQLEAALEVYAAKGAASSEERDQITTKKDFLNDAPIRMYKFTPSKIFVSNEATKWNGKWIDTRSEVKLKK